jgi:hypothetical protein
VPAPGQSWEIDEPGFAFGDIFEHFASSTALAGSQLDNSNGLPASSPDDVSMALGLNLVLNSTELARISFLLSETLPTSGFYLEQTDPDSGVHIYFSSSTAIRIPGVPDLGPSLWLLAISAGPLLASTHLRFGRR